MSTAEEFYAAADHATIGSGEWEKRVTVVPTEWYTSAAPPRRWLLRDGRAGSEGVLPLAKVGLFVAVHATRDRDHPFRGIVITRFAPS